MSDLTARRWTADSDEESGGDLLRWNENVIAQVTGEESDGCMEAYAALVKAVASMDRIEALEAENDRLREALRDWPWVPAIDVEAFYRNQARDQ